MKEALFNAIMQEDMAEVASQMIFPSRDFTGGSYPYEVDLEKSAVYYDGYNFLIRTDVWMKNILEFDDFSREVNRYLYLSHMDDEKFDFWDYEIGEYLQKLGIEVEIQNGGYTYNNPDYCCLDRSIHYTIFDHDGENYIVFAVHYGADARVGFGWNACFKLRDYDYFFLSQEVSAYDSGAEEDVDISNIEEIANYDKEADVWTHKVTGSEIYIESPADGF